MARRDRAAVRIRADHKKVKSGCRTCKSRRVKCDEGRPACSRCVNYGRVCGGYPLGYQKGTAEAATLPFIFPKSRASPLITTQPSTALFKTELEQRYFRLFCDKIAFEISGYFDSELWSRLVLQACHIDPSIRHGIVAIAALSTTVESSQLSALRQANDEAQKHHRFALQQYGAAIRKMREAASSGKQDLRTMLISCIVTTCFESFHGNQAAANAQIQTGLNLVAELFAEHSSWERSNVSSLGQKDVEDEVVQVFNRLDIQNMAFQDSRPIASHQKLARLGQSSIDHMPERFSTSIEARKYLETVMQRAMHFMASLDPIKHPECDKDGYNYLCQFHVAEMHRWDKAFNHIFQHACTAIKSLHDHDLPLPPSKDLIVPQFLRLHWLATFVALKAPISADMRVFMPEFREIVAISRAIYPLGYVASGRFTFDFQAIVPLYYVAISCPHRLVRREALALLLESPRREGLWDGFLAAKVAKTAMEAEEKAGLDGDFVRQRINLDVVGGFSTNVHECVFYGQKAIDSLAK